jgi:transposase
MSTAGSVTQSVAPRDLKARQLAAAMKLRRRGALWLVPSQSKNIHYAVDATGEKPFCDCPDFETRHLPCKHILAVEHVIKGEETPDGTVTYTESVKVTYSQEWPAYNQAQRDEKREFMRLLHDLCQLVPEPVQTFGRPRLALGDMVFSSALKVYSTVSGRRFMGDLDTALEKGYIARIPHYNSVFAYMENPDLTPILKRLVEVSSAPLKAVESSFAVDSSGFSASRFDRWYSEKYGKEKSKRQWVKAHLMCGVKTNVVTSVEITPSNANDSPYLAPLVDSTAKRFDIQEVSADKAYLSNANLAHVERHGATAYIPFKVNTLGTGSPIWEKMYHYFMAHRDSFLEHYHQRSNVETTFSMIKAKFGDAVRSKTETGQVNEVLLKVLCHNIVVLVLAIYDLGLKPAFASEMAFPGKH